MVGKTSSQNEALSRCFINLIIFQCVLDKRNATSKIQLKPPISSEATVRPATPIKADSSSTSLELSVPLKDLSLFVEMELKQEITDKGRPHLLTGIADSTLGYSNLQSISGNLIIVEAKRRYNLAGAYGQLLS